MDDICRATNWPAVATWAISEVISLPLALLTPVSLYFTPVITIVVSCSFYVGLTKLFVKSGWLIYEDEDDDGGDDAKSEEIQA